MGASVRSEARGTLRFPRSTDQRKDCASASLLALLGLSLITIYFRLSDKTVVHSPLSHSAVHVFSAVVVPPTTNSTRMPQACMYIASPSGLAIASIADPRCKAPIYMAFHPMQWRNRLQSFTPQSATAKIRRAWLSHAILKIQFLRIWSNQGDRYLIGPGRDFPKLASYDPWATASPTRSDAVSKLRWHVFLIPQWAMYVSFPRVDLRVWVQMWLRNNESV